MATPESERMLCDSSFVGHISKRLSKPERYAHWDHVTLSRIDRAILAISVMTLAEARAGWLNAGWGEPRIRKEKRRLEGFLHVPLASPDLDEWARLKDAAKKNGLTMSDNDIWIAATASVRGWPLVSCDQDHDRLASHLPVEVTYLQSP